MRTLKHTLYFAIILAILFSPLAAFGEEKEATDRDRVILKNGKVVVGKVISFDYSNVKLASKTIVSQNVARIVFFDTPSDYNEALDLIDNEKYDRALFKLKLAEETPGVRDWINLFVAVQRINILWKQEKWREAREKCIEINNNFKNHFYLTDTSWKIPVALIKVGDFKNAEESFEAVYQDSRLKDFEIHWQAWYWKIFTIELRGDYREAYQQYLNLAQESYRQLSSDNKTALTTGKNLPDDVKYLGELYLEGTFRGYINMALAGKLAEAKKELEELAAKHSVNLKNLGNLGLAIASVIEIQTLEEITDEHFEKLAQARLLLSKSFIYEAKTLERRAELLYWLAKACLLSSDNEKAVAYLSIIVEKYSASMVSKTAKKLLDELSKSVEDIGVKEE